MNIEEIENDMILAEKIMRIQEHITETIKEHGDISQFKEDVLYVIHFLLEKQLTSKQLTATQIQAKQMEYAVSKEKIKKDEEYIRLLKCELDKKDKIIELMSEQLAGLAIWNNEKEESLILASKEEVIEHFKAMSEKPTKGE